MTYFTIDTLFRASLVSPGSSERLWQSLLITYDIDYHRHTFVVCIDNRVLSASCAYANAIEAFNRV